MLSFITFITQIVAQLSLLLELMPKKGCTNSWSSQCCSIWDDCMQTYSYLLHILEKKSRNLFPSQCNPQQCKMTHPHAKYFAASNQSHKCTSLSSSIFSGSIDTAGSVTHNDLWAFTQLCVNEFSVCDLFSPHSAGVGLALVLYPVIWSMEINLMCDWVCLYLPQFSGWNCAPDLTEMQSPNHCVQRLLIMRKGCTQ